MGGLQKNLITRSERIVGSYVLFLDQVKPKDRFDIKRFFEEKEIQGWSELELEILVKNRGYLSPVVLHGVFKENTPEFLEEKDLKGIVLGSDLSYKLKTGYEDEVLVISPGHFDPILGNIPRHSQTQVLDIINTNVPEIDLFHAWVRISFLQNLIKEKTFNLIRFGPFSIKEDEAAFLRAYAEIKDVYSAIRLKTWADLHPTLNKALNLETSVMVFLFLSMTFLVSIAITSGVLIFMEKVNKDIISMWILGSSPSSLRKSSQIFFFSLNFLCILLGTGFGIFVLFLIENYAGNIMPDVFIDRNIPVNITKQGLLISIIGPLSISSFFSFFAFAQFRTDSQTFLEKIRTTG